jgi:hypothetical protein
LCGTLTPKTAIFPPGKKAGGKVSFQTDFQKRLKVLLSARRGFSYWSGIGLRNVVLSSLSESASKSSTFQLPFFQAGILLF